MHHHKQPILINSTIIIVISSPSSSSLSSSPHSLESSSSPSSSPLSSPPSLSSSYRRHHHRHQTKANCVILTQVTKVTRALSNRHSSRVACFWASYCSSWMAMSPRGLVTSCPLLFTLSSNGTWTSLAGSWSAYLSQRLLALSLLRSFPRVSAWRPRATG